MRPTGSGDAVTAAVAVHLVLTSIHGLAHLAIPVRIAGWQFACSTVVLFVLPVVAAGLRRRGRIRTGTGVALAAGFAALAFEAVLHFGVPNPDHVASVDRGYRLFASTAGLTLAGDVALVATAAWVRRGHAQGSSATACNDSTT